MTWTCTWSRNGTRSTCFATKPTQCSDIIECSTGQQYTRAQLYTREEKLHETHSLSKVQYQPDEYPSVSDTDESCNE